MSYRHSDKWTKAHTEHNFTIEIVRWSFDSTPDENNWNVYAYLYPNHPLFQVLDKEVDKGIWSDGLDGVPFHGGCTLRHHITTNEASCIKIGCDYQHYGDERFRQLRTKEQAKEIFDDADFLANYLIGYGLREPSSDEQNPSQ